MRFKFPKISKNWLIPVLGVLAIILVFSFSSEGKAFFKRMSVYFENSSNPSLSSSPRNFWLPSGKETYQVVQAAGADPRIHEATIDPPDVHVGDIQKLSIIVSSEYDIESVVAKTETDRRTQEIPLKYVREVKDGELLPPKYSIGKNNELVIKSDNAWQSFTRLVRPVEAHEPPKLLYEATWKVADTHSKKYYTTFIVRNTRGQENSITIAWSDPCAIPNNGDWSLVSNNNNCILNSVDGVDNGNATIATYTLTLNSTFAFNPGRTITISSGAISIGTGGEIKQTYLWKVDQDQDGWAGSEQRAQDTTPGGLWARKSNWTGITYSNDDCYDSNSAAFPAPTPYYTTHRGDGSFDYNCDGAQEARWGVISCGDYNSNPSACDAANGFINSAPACGDTGTLANCFWHTTNNSCFSAPLGGQQPCY